MKRATSFSKQAYENVNHDMKWELTIISVPKILILPNKEDMPQAKSEEEQKWSTSEMDVSERNTILKKTMTNSMHIIKCNGKWIMM